MALPNEYQSPTPYARHSIGLTASLSLTSKTKDCFKRFTNIWGEKWSTQFNKNPEGLSEEWQDALKDMSKDQIKNAISAARSKYIWPPNISEFLELCRQAPNSQLAMQRSHLCAVSGCPDSGSICPEVRGDAWYCSRHYREKF